ncbi:MAG: galactokinase [Chloroflexota bacterium]|nr:galactokinase [Chloroflexota bacterium]
MPTEPTAPVDAGRRRSLLGALAQVAGPARDTGSARVVRAPGRVNLIGEHTDYNLGFVMPAAIGLETWIGALPRPDRRVELTSLEQAETLAFDLDAIPPPSGGWIDYVAGTAQALLARGVALRGFTGVVETAIPIGSGLSSSAALELASALALAADVPPALPPLELARAAQQAENDYVGVRCGIMDQFASVFGAPGAAIVLDCRSLEHQLVPLPSGHVLVALDTRSPHRLETSEYNARRRQCEDAVRALAARYPQVRSLRDVEPAMLDELAALVDDETARRVRHVVSENERVLATAAALRAGRLSEVGRLMAESHASLRDDYEVSSAELDALVEIATGVPGVVGARMTGAGFGGCTVNVVELEAVDRLRGAVTREYRARTGRDAGFHVVAAVAGAGVVD